MSDYKDRMGALRAAMKEQGLQGFIVPKADEYQGEYTAAYAERLAWLTGFTGSAGVGVVLAERAVVMTDARYLIQVREQVDPDLFETADSTKTSIAGFLEENAGKDAVIGYDPWLHTPSQIEKLEKEFKGTLKALDQNPVDLIWPDQPARPQGIIEIFPNEVAGKTSAEKRREVAGILKKEGVDAFMVTRPDSLAWLLNIRGCDVPYNPVVLSYGILKQDSSFQWFIDPQRATPDVKNHIGSDVDVYAPEEMEEHIRKVSQDKKTSRIGLDFDSVPLWFRDCLYEANAEFIKMKDPCTRPKSLKTRAEQEAIRQAHIVDGVALTRFLHWFDKEALKGGLSELDVQGKLHGFRKESGAFLYDSFPTIAGFGAHGAIIHYRAIQESNAKIKPPGVLLLDSGGQYHFGTTDITRTVGVGEAPEAVKENFTRVLKGHIALANAKFPSGTTGAQLDGLARQALWQAGLDYAHGTGHGVGCFLNVHEGGVNISARGHGVIEPGMLISNEPGYYEEGKYGIRIENLILSIKDDRSGMLCFESVSLAPIDLNLIVRDILSAEEILWLNAYHARVFEVLSPHIPEDVRGWLEEKTRPV